MLLVGDCQCWTRRLLGQQLAVSGLQAGEVVIVHAGLRSVGAMLNGPGQRALIGAAPSVLVPAAAIVTFAVEWLEQRFGQATALPE